MKTVEVLQGARDLISDPKRWTTKVSARNSEGKYVSWNNPTAVCFCSVSALAKACPDLGISPAIVALRKVMRGGVSWFNDTHNHAEVLAAFDLAIENCKN